MLPAASPREIRVSESRHGISTLCERSIARIETINELAQQTLAPSLATMELNSVGQRTSARVTVQVTSFVGHGMIESMKAGYTGSLGQTARHFSERSQRASA
jgi:hypothetical protein